jgi:hypothetical protein
MIVNPLRECHQHAQGSIELPKEKTVSNDDDPPCVYARVSIDFFGELYGLSRCSLPNLGMNSFLNGFQDLNRKQKVRRDDVSSKLLQLNLHRAIDSCSRFMLLLDNYPKKRGNHTTPSAQFLTETAEEISDIFGILYQMCFCVNAISGGKDIAFYQALDQLKDRVKACFDPYISNQPGKDTSEVRPSKRVTETGLLELIAGYFLERTYSDDTAAGMSPIDCETAHDAMLYCCKRLLDLLDRQLAVSRADRQESGEENLIVTIPVGYLEKEHDRYAIEFEQDSSATDGTSPYRVAELLVNGIKAVVSNGYCEPLPERPETEAKHDGLLFYSVDTITLYYLTHRFASIVTGNVCDAVGGNYLNLLISPVVDDQQHGRNHLLIRKLLHWLDFDTFDSGSVTIASVKNITRFNMENHLTVLGKLLCFVSSPRVLSEDEPSLDRNVELFLENVE